MGLKTINLLEGFRIDNMHESIRSSSHYIDVILFENVYCVIILFDKLSLLLLAVPTIHCSTYTSNYYLIIMMWSNQWSNWNPNCSFSDWMRHNIVLLGGKSIDISTKISNSEKCSISIETDPAIGDIKAGLRECFFGFTTVKMKPIFIKQIIVGILFIDLLRFYAEISSYSNWIQDYFFKHMVPNSGWHIDIQLTGFRRINYSFSIGLDTVWRRYHFKSSFNMLVALIRKYCKLYWWMQVKYLFYLILSAVHKISPSNAIVHIYCGP